MQFQIILQNLEFGNLVYLSDEEKAVVNKQIEEQASKPRELHYGYLGNGVTVYDVSRTEHNDYPTVAHISDNGEINYRTDDLSDSEKSEIENYAQDVKNKFQESNINLISEDNLLYRSDSSISWAYYNADGNDGNGQFVVMTIDSDVIEDAAREYPNETNAFINHIYENSTTTIADKGTAEFDSYFNDFYHYYSSDTVLPNTKKIKNDDERIISELISYANVKKLSETLGCSNEALTRLTDMSRFKLRGTGKPYDDTTLPQLLFENITDTVDVNKAKTYFDSISDEDAKKKADKLIKNFVIKGGYDIDTKVDTYINSDKNDELIEKLDVDFYRIYQIKAGEQYHNNRFASYDDNIAQGFIPNLSQYELVYEGKLKDIDGETINEVLENIYEKFNMNRPEDFTGHSLSVSDIITIGNEELTVHYVDRYNFHNVDANSFFENKTPQDTHLVINDFGIDLDFKDFYGLDLITRSESYSSDLDENGHVMKDHSNVEETVISYYYDNNEFYKSEFGYDDTKTDLASIKAEIIEFCEHMDSSDSISYHDKNGNDKTVEVDAGFVSYWDKPIFVTDGFIYEGTEHILTKYLYYTLKNMQEKLHKMKKGGGVPHVQGKAIEKIAIPLPPLSEQERIQKAVDSSPNLRSKKKLIETFIANIITVDDVATEWQSFVAEEREKELKAIIQEEKLKETETRKYISNAFREGEIKTSGTDIDAILPPISRFGGGGSNRSEKKKTVIGKLKAFVEKFFGIGGGSI